MSSVSSATRNTPASGTIRFWLHRQTSTVERVSSWCFGSGRGGRFRLRLLGIGEWWRWEELNLRHGAYETPALPLSYTADLATPPSLEVPYDRRKGFYRGPARVRENMPKPSCSKAARLSPR